MLRCRGTYAHRWLAPAAVLLLIVVATGCGDSASSAVNRTTIDVTMHDFGIRVSRRHNPAGNVVLHVRNNGPSTHELNVDVTRYAAGKIPLQRDGVTANEDAKGLHRVDSIEQLSLHHTADLALRLKPGRYALWCNLEGHYLGGMHEVLDVG
jgi:uncharacterized cupredoxin-like copper-binding protein